MPIIEDMGFFMIISYKNLFLPGPKSQSCFRKKRLLILCISSAL